jgi:hypothetical protein
MVNSIHDLIINVMPSDNPGGWIADKKQLKYREGVISSEALPIEKAYVLMHRHLRNYSKNTHLTNEDKAELLSLKSAVEKKRDDYKDQHKGFFGKIGLWFAGIGIGHIDTVSKKVIADIDRLSQKQELTLDFFLSQTAPPLEQIGETKRLWVYSRRSGQIEEREGGRPLKKGETDDLLSILTVMNRQLNNFSEDQPITRFQQQSLKLLRDNVRLEIFAQKDTALFEQLHQEILGKIDPLLNAVPSDKIENDTGWTLVFNEILKTEATFLDKLETSSIHLDHLKTLAQDDKIKVNRKILPFFRTGKVGEEKTLEDCKKAYQAFISLAQKFHHELLLIDQKTTVEEKTVELSKLLRSSTFLEYVEGSLACMGYINELNALSQSLRAKNPQSAIDEYCNHNMGPGGDRAPPESDFSFVVSRVSRLGLLSKELLTKTRDNRLYRVAFSNFSRINSLANYQNRQLS